MKAVTGDIKINKGRYRMNDGIGRVERDVTVYGEALGTVTRCTSGVHSWIEARTPDGTLVGNGYRDDDRAALALFKYATGGE